MQLLRDLVKHWKSAALLCVSALGGIQDVRGDYVSTHDMVVTATSKEAGVNGYDKLYSYVMDPNKNSFTHEQICLLANKNGGVYPYATPKPGNNRYFKEQEVNAVIALFKLFTDRLALPGEEIQQLRQGNVALPQGFGSHQKYLEDDNTKKFLWYTLLKLMGCYAYSEEGENDNGFEKYKDFFASAIKESFEKLYKNCISSKKVPDPTLSKCITEDNTGKMKAFVGLINNKLLEEANKALTQAQQNNDTVKIQKAEEKVNDIKQMSQNLGLNPDETNVQPMDPAANPAPQPAVNLQNNPGNLQKSPKKEAEKQDSFAQQDNQIEQGFGGGNITSAPAPVITPQPVKKPVAQPVSLVAAPRKQVPAAPASTPQPAVKTQSGSENPQQKSTPKVVDGHYILEAVTPLRNSLPQKAIRRGTRIKTGVKLTKEDLRVIRRGYGNANCLDDITFEQGYKLQEADRKAGKLYPGAK